jgi:hypothetical protein
MGDAGKGARFGVAGALAIAILVLATVGCGANVAGAEIGGCDLGVREHAATLKPRSSGMSCAQIDRMIGGLPAEPGGFLLGDLNQKNVYWHCHLYAPIEPGSPILHCILGRREFEIDAK